jgi:uncharacterized repeat protein (TIGR02543 family)
MGEVIMGKIGYSGLGSGAVGRGDGGRYGSFFAMILVTLLLFAGSAEAVVYTITFNTNGGSELNVKTAKTPDGGGSLDAWPAEPTRLGYRFDGWYQTTSGGLEKYQSDNYTANTTLYARWTEIYKVYTITFSPNGGSALTVSSAKTNEVGMSSAWPAEPTRTGYDFGGWYTTSGTTGGLEKTSYSVFTANTTVYARWAIKTWTITFNPNGGTITIMSGTTGTGWKLSSLPTPAARTGYTFDGWYTSDTDGDKVTTAYVFDGTVTTIYAHWKPIVYKISYNLDGGTLELPNPTEYTIESTEITLLPPTKIAYTFAGWTSAENSTVQKEVYIRTGSTGNKTYTAKWTPEYYTIRFEPNGGTLATAETKTVAGGTLSALPTPAPKEGYTFDAWYTLETGGVKVETNKTVFGEDAVIYAHWTPITYKITYTLNNGTLAFPNPATYNIETQGFELYAPTRLAYTFDGWTGSNGTVPDPNVLIGQGSIGDKNYTANWTPEYYVITFEPKGGAMTQESAGTILGGKLETLPMPLKEGNIFEGWFMTEVGGEKVTTNTIFGGDVTIYAMWTPIYTITFYANGGTVSQVTGTTGSGGKLATLPTPTRNGYSFDGWFTEEAGGVKITKDQVFSKDMTIYAQWTLITYVAVTFSAGEHGTITATVDGNPIASGALIQRGKNVVFTATASTGYTTSGWTVNGAAAATSSPGTYTLANIPTASTVTVSFIYVSVATPDRVIPNAASDDGAAAIAPVSPLTAEFTAGPNPASATLGAVNFFHSGSNVKEAALLIYDASGNVINTVRIGTDIGGKGKRSIASWDLRDAKGRPVPEGTYLVKGTIKTANGKRERVLTVVGVRGR